MQPTTQTQRSSTAVNFKWNFFSPPPPNSCNKVKRKSKEEIKSVKGLVGEWKRGWLNAGRCHESLKPGRASVPLIRPWLLPGLTAREWEEKGWLHTAQSARKPPNSRANTGQVIWRLKCIKAIYKGLKDLRLLHPFGLHFYTTWHRAAQFSLNQYERVIKNVAFTGVWLFV